MHQQLDTLDVRILEMSQTVNTSRLPLRFASLKK
jgi:hypothetical protein